MIYLNNIIINKMEYGQKIIQDYNLNPGYKKYVSWDLTMTDANMQKLWDKETLLKCQNIITERLQKDIKDQKIIVPFETISSIIFQCYQTNQPKIGDIHTRYIIGTSRNDLGCILEKAINIIVTQIRNEYVTNQNNQRLSIWNTLYGDCNKEGLRAHAPIKIRERRSERLQFHMNY